MDDVLKSIKLKQMFDSLTFIHLVLELLQGLGGAGTERDEFFAPGIDKCGQSLRL